MPISVVRLAGKYIVLAKRPHSRRNLQSTLDVLHVGDSGRRSSAIEGVEKVDGKTISMFFVVFAWITGMDGAK